MTQPHHHHHNNNYNGHYYLYLTNILQNHPILRRQPLQIIIGVILFLTILLHKFHYHPSSTSSSNNYNARNELASRLAEPGTAYRGTLWHNEQTVSVETLGETKFARCDVHTVRRMFKSCMINRKERFFVCGI